MNRQKAGVKTYGFCYADLMNQAVDPRIVTLIAVKPGLMRDSLLAFLRAVRAIDIAALVVSPEAVVESVSHFQPHALVLDAAFSDEGALLRLVQRLKLEFPFLNCVVLANNLRQQHAFIAAGATHVLLKGHLDARLSEAIMDASSNPAINFSRVG